MCVRAYLGHLETGRRPPTRDVATALDAALGTAGLLVALADAERQGDDVRRREALAGIVVLLAGTPTTLETVLSAGIEAAMSDGRDPDDWQSHAELLGADCMTTPGGDLQDRLARDLAVLQHRLTTPDMWTAAARLLAVYGKTQRDPVTATRWYRLAADAADRSRRDDIRVWVRGRTALALGYEGALPAVALDMADQGLALAGDRPSLGSLQAHMARAHVLGIRGDRDGAMEALESAERAFDVAGSDEQISDFAVPEWRMRTFTSMLLSRL
ncbi:MAG TPA: XRE family transcriptional regulator, partial [Micromonosporaceae bacterium]|nr:XRE family transcriptional regulator [Micromonosporaceae bacterium]